MSETIVHVRHIRGVQQARGKGLCASGCRSWFKDNGLDWSRFLTHGITATELRATNSALCEQVIAVAERERNPVGGSNGQ